MAQTFGMGRYVPPELEGTVSHNQASGKGHALGARARKLQSEGILIVRFECPFPIWCTNCEPEQIIGQGVRFNAEKKKVGNYYSTAIWSFRFKHTVCGKWLEVRTDPKNAEYVVMDGGRRRDYGATQDSLLEDSFRLGSGVTEEEKERLEKEGGFAALEKKIEDKQQHDSQTKRIAELSRKSDQDWSDPYEMSRKLRRGFRVGRRQRQAEEKSGETLQEKYGIGIDLLAPLPEDEERSKLITFGPVHERQPANQGMFDQAGLESKTASTSSAHRSGKRKKEQDSADQQKKSLRTALQGSTRSTIDPFLQAGNGWAPETKRRQNNDQDTVQAGVEAQGTKHAEVKNALISYDSDST